MTKRYFTNSTIRPTEENRLYAQTSLDGDPPMNVHDIEPGAMEQRITQLEATLLTVIPGEVLEAPEMEAGLIERIEPLEDALLAVVRRLAVIEWQMEAINGESSQAEV